MSERFAKQDWITCLGAGLLWCWFDKRDYGWTLSYYGITSSMLIPCIIVTLIVAGGSCTYIFRRSRTGGTSLDNGVATEIAAAACAIGRTLCLLGISSYDSPLAVSGAVTQAIGFAFLFSAWATRIVSVDAEKTASLAAGMLAASAVADALLALALHLLGGMSEPTMLLIGSALPLVSVILLHIRDSFKEAAREPEPPRVAADTTRKLNVGPRVLVAIALVCMAAGFVMGLGFSVSELDATASLALYAMRVLIIAALFGTLLGSNGKLLYAITRGGLLVMALGCIASLYFFAGFFIGLIGNLLLTVGFDCLLVFLCSITSRLARTTQTGRVTTLAAIQVFVYLSVALGMVVALIVSPAAPNDGLSSIGPFQIAAALVTWLLVAGSSLLYDNGDGIWTSLRYTSADISQLYEEPTAETRARLIALKFGLSDRETEVARYLAAGYSYAAIGEKMFLSVNTIKTYVQSIYSKTGVHSKQAFIDLLEHIPRD